MELKKNADLLTSRRARFFNMFSLIGCTVLVIFGVVNISQSSKVSGIIEVAIGIGGVINVILFRLNRHLHTAAAILLVLMITTLCLLLFSGGIADTGIFWFFIFPVLAFFFWKGR